MKELHEVRYTITDKGATYPDQKKEVILKKGDTVKTALERELKKYRRALSLSTKFEFKIIVSQLVGYCQ
ncbi:MAG: hypothetical protein WCL70_08570 [Paludibacter sp.]|jgi:hypothetical protein